MTYCVGLLVKAGIVLLSDTRTNAGVDNISTYRKMFTFEAPGERVLVIMTAGSLSTTQTTLARLNEAIAAKEPSPQTSIMAAETMLDVAQIVGQTLAQTMSEIDGRMPQQGPVTAASMILAGQRAGGDMRMFLIYPEGNFIEATPDTPYLQIGEHKYGKPILDRVVNADTPLAEARKAALLSMDSTLRSNLSVGMPLDLVVIEKDALRISEERRFDAQDESFREMSEAWSDALRAGFAKITI
jgi:putative proteasome-type protease